ncbi:unnamed protein product [Spirodela intermedia]|uniref:DRBM domain-containing protein n=1 Tax=Spirodela intermedia TaxID=51605 RepID=A0A7I8IZ59_SPIIN|nr:unnamed protein product [Spirodela intermedia]CAA6662441.1 unnamed protein product [Spirodela intermedia]
MYKNQLQELAQRSCFNLPSYTCIREGPDHAPRFKATVNFNGETFESTGFFTTLRQAEHSAAEVALSALSTRGPSHSLTARILFTRIYCRKLLREGAPLPSYTTTRSGLGHPPVFTGTVELAGIIFTGEPAKNKKQAEKNSAMAAWSSLKQPVPLQTGQETRRAATSFSGSKILPFIQQRSTTRARPTSLSPIEAPLPPSLHLPAENGGFQLPKFPAAGAAPYVPIRHCRPFVGGMVPPVTIRTAVPVFSAPSLPLPTSNTMNYHQPQPQRSRSRNSISGSSTISILCR